MNTLAGVLSRAAALVVFAFGAVSAQAADLTTQDYIDIEQLYATYNHAIDAGDGEAWAATFTPDGTFSVYQGKDALVGFINTWREKMNGAHRRHWNTNLRITPSAEGANATVMLMLLDVGAQPASIVNTGYYTDVLVKTPNGWRFKSRKVQSDAPRMTLSAPDAARP